MFMVMSQSLCFPWHGSKHWLQLLSFPDIFACSCDVISGLLLGGTSFCISSSDCCVDTNKPIWVRWSLCGWLGNKLIVNLSLWHHGWFINIHFLSRLISLQFTYHKKLDALKSIFLGLAGEWVSGGKKGQCEQIKVLQLLWLFSRVKVLK